VKTLWQPGTYWVVWLSVFAGTFLLREVWALASGRSQDTLSDWVWNLLRITSNEPVSGWNSTDFLVFGAWLTVVIWLTYHFFFRVFT
jgi:hypothetical protein